MCFAFTANWIYGIYNWFWKNSGGLKLFSYGTLTNWVLVQAHNRKEADTVLVKSSVSYLFDLPPDLDSPVGVRVEEWGVSPGPGIIKFSGDQTIPGPKDPHDN